MNIFTHYTEKTRAQFIPVNQNHLAWEMYVTGGGFDDMAAGTTFVNEGRPELYRMEQGAKRILPEYVFMYILEGSGNYVSDAVGTIPVRKGAFFILFPGLGHQILPNVQDGWKDVWITANGPYIHRLTQQKILRPTAPIVYLEENNMGITALNRIQQLVERILDNPEQNDLSYTSILHGCITDFVKHQVKKEEYHPLNEDLANKLVHAACTEIWNWGHRDIDIQLIAKKLQVNRRTLERYFIKVLDRTIGDEIHRCRVYRAIILLQQTDIKIEQIAMMSGFPNYLQMIRVFKRLLNKTPGQYRE